MGLFEVPITILKSVWLEIALINFTLVRTLYKNCGSSWRSI